MAKARKIANVFGNPNITLTTSKNTRMIVTEKEVAPDAIWIIYRQYRNDTEIYGWAVTKEEAVERLKILGRENEVFESEREERLICNYYFAKTIARHDYYDIEH